MQLSCMLTCDLLYCFEFVYYQELTGLVQGHSWRPCSHEMVIGQSQIALFHAVTIISRVALTGFIFPCTNYQQQSLVVLSPSLISSIHYLHTHTDSIDQKMSALLWLVLVCTGGLLARFKRPTKWGLYVISTMVIVRSLITFGVRPTLFILGFLQVAFQWLRMYSVFVTHSNLDTLQQAYSLF